MIELPPDPVLMVSVVRIEVQATQDHILSYLSRGESLGRFAFTCLSGIASLSTAHGATKNGKKPKTCHCDERA